MMQMSVSQSATATPQPVSAGASAVKAGDKAAFVLALGQTISDVQGTGQPAEPAQLTADGLGQTAASSALASLIGQQASSEDLLAGIEQLLQKLDTLDTQADASKPSKENLSDALALMDDLLSLLGFAPVIQPQQADEASTQSANGTGQGISGQEAVGTAAFWLPTMAPSSSRSAVELPNLEKSFGITADTADAMAGFEFSALKSGLQEALFELRDFIKENKGSAMARNAFAVISQRLEAAEQLLSGGTVNGAGARNVDDAGASVVEAVRTMQTAAAANAHLRKMAHQLLPAGLVASLPSADETTAATDQPKSPLSDTMPLAISPGDIQLPNRQSLPIQPMTQQPVPVQQFVQTMQGLVVKQFTVSSASGIHEAKISLFPEQLGQVDVRISLHNGQLTALFITDTAAAKDALDNQMAQLRSALQVQGLHVDKLEVSQNQPQQAFFQERQGHQGREQQSSKRNKSRDGAEREIAGFDADLERMAAGAAVHRDLGLGRGIHTTV